MARWYSRDDWGAANVRRSSRFDPSDVRGVAIHWNGPPVGASTYRGVESSVASTLRGVQRFHTADPPVGRGWCVDTETEILTQRGWMYHEELREGDMTLGVNPDTWLSEWTPVLAVNRFTDGPYDAVHYSGRGHDSVTTPEHRWLTERWDTHTRRWVRGEWRTTKHLNNNVRIPSALPCADVATEAKYEDAFVELVSWWAAEGGRNGSAGTIAQSPSANPLYCDRIRAVLTALYGPAVDAPRLSGRGWREVYSEGAGCINFRVSSEIVSDLDHVAPRAEGARQPTFAFVASLTRSQLRLFIDTFVDGDGWRCGEQAHVAQKYRGMVEPYQFAATLLGIPTSLNWEAADHQRWRLSFRTVATATPTTARTSSPGAVKVDEVWCPTTELGTWYARRNGTSYFTGNSDIAYNLFVDTEGRVWEGRGLEYRSAANGNTTANRRYVAIYCLLGEGQETTPAMLDGVREAIALTREKYPRAREIRTHHDVRGGGTECPGGELTRLVESGALEPGSAPTTTTPVAPSEEDDMTPGEREMLKEIHDATTGQPRAVIAEMATRVRQINNGVNGGTPPGRAKTNTWALSRIEQRQVAQDATIAALVEVVRERGDVDVDALLDGVEQRVRAVAADVAQAAADAARDADLPAPDEVPA